MAAVCMCAALCGLVDAQTEEGGGGGREVEAACLVRSLTKGRRRRRSYNETLRPACCAAIYGYIATIHGSNERVAGNEGDF